MKFFLRRSWICWGLFFCCLHLASVHTHAQAGAGPVIEKIEIRHVGPPAASEELVRAQIKVRSGDVYNPNGINDDVLTLYSTGLFHNVQMQEERLPGNKVNLTYLLQGKATLTDIRFEGNEKYRAAKLLKKITSKTGEPLDEQKLFRDGRALEEVYQKAGYQRTEVTPVSSIDPDTLRGTVTFQIKEAPKIKIDRIEFVGANAFTERKLRKVIKTRRRWMFSWITGSGVLKDDVFEADKDLLADFYHNEGYIDFQFADIKLDQVDPKHMVIRFELREGQQFKVGSVDITGNKVFTDEEILSGAERFAKPDKKLSGLRAKPDKTFTPTGLLHDIQAIEDFYGSRGYIDVRVDTQKIPNVEKGTMDLVHRVLFEDRGVSYVEKIEIRGNTKTRDKVIRRELAISPGEVFDMVRVKRSKGRLEQMTYFDKIETEIEPTDISSRKNLVIGLEEATTGNVEMGAGFSSIDSLVGFVGYREGNFDLFNPPYFRGGGQKFRINLQLGTRRRDMVVEFVEPWFLGRKLAFGTQLYYRELNFYSDIYDISQIGARFSLTRTLGSDFLLGSLSYTLENIGIDNVDPTAPKVIRDEEGDRLASKVGASLAYDTRNNALIPDRGQRTELTGEFAGGPFAGETDFYKIKLNTSWYFPGFKEGHILEVLGQAGVVNEFGDSTRVPLFDRFFLGGVYSLRGFRFHDVGPRYVDPATGVLNDEPIGGEMFWYGSVEYSIPIIDRLRVAAFYDIGMVYENAYKFTLSPGQESFTDDWGVGVRLNIPRLGPLRLDYAFPIHHDNALDGKGRFQFSVGFFRDF